MKTIALACTLFLATACTRTPTREEVLEQAVKSACLVNAAANADKALAVCRGDAGLDRSCAAAVGFQLADELKDCH